MSCLTNALPDVLTLYDADDMPSVLKAMHLGTHSLYVVFRKNKAWATFLPLE